MYDLCFKATFVHMVGQMGQVTYKGNEVKSKMKISYAHAEIWTQVVVICDPTRCQLDQGGVPSQ